MKPETFICIQCKTEKPMHGHGCGTGYGVNAQDQKICYACIGENDRKELEQAKPGDRFTFYFEQSKRAI